MPGGLLQLINYGIQDDVLMKNPDITFFKTVYRKYTNFSVDTLTSLHDVKYGTENVIKVPNSGELLYKLFFKLELPNISAKYNTSYNAFTTDVLNNKIYNYTISTYNSNISIIKNITYYLSNIINSLNNDKSLTEFLTYISSDGSLRKLYNLYESSNMLYYDYNINNSKLIKNSEYYKNRSILNKYDYTIDAQNDGYSFTNFNYLNESNYYYRDNKIYDSTFTEFLNYIICMIYSNKIDDNASIKILTANYLSSLYNKLNYNIVTSFNYYNVFKNQLYVNTMPNDFLRQHYMISEYNYDFIDNIMEKTKVNGTITTYDNNLIKRPKYLIFNDLSNPNIIIVVVITKINQYMQTDKYYKTINRLYYDYSGYVANVDYMNNVIMYTRNFFPEYYTRSIQFDKVVMNNFDNTYKIITINLPIMFDTNKKIYNIDVSRSSDMLSYIYEIKLDLNGVVGSGMVKNFLNDQKYVIYTCNYYSSPSYKNKYNDKLFDLPPIVVLLIDSSKPFVFDNNILTIYCKNSVEPYNIKQLNILSPYIPILTLDGTLFNTEIGTTDYKLQGDYMSKNGFLPEYIIDNAANFVINFPLDIFDINNQVFNTSVLTSLNTITTTLSSDCNINNDKFYVNQNFELNKTQQNVYKNNLKINNTITTTLTQKTNEQYNNYYKLLSQSYQNISLDDANTNVIEYLLGYMHATELNKKYIKNIPYKHSVDFSSFFTVIFTKQEYPLLSYNDIKLTPINSQYQHNILKLKLLNSTINDLSDGQKNYMQSGNALYVKKELKYKSFTYKIVYTYLILYTININDDYLEIFASNYRTDDVNKLNYELYKNDIIVSYPYTDPDDILIINQKLSFIPTQNDQIYDIYTDDPSILFKMNYTNKENFMCYCETYYLSSQIALSSISDVWELQDNYNRKNEDNKIYDIISAPFYLYNKFNYDYVTFYKQIRNDFKYHDLFMHDIFIMMLYESYKYILYNKDNVSDVIGFILQNNAFILSSSFKDPYIEFKNHNNLSINQEFKSLEDIAIDDTSNYSNYNKDGYNLLTITTNNLILSPDHIYNTALLTANNLDINFLNYAANNIIFNEENIKKILSNALINNNESFITTDKIIELINDNYTYSNIYSILYKMSTNKTFNIYPDPNQPSSKYALLNLSLANTIYNDTDISFNKNNLLSLLETLRINLANPTNEIYFNIDKCLIDNVRSSDKLLYITEFNNINDCVKTYFQIYLKRSGVLDSLVDKEITTSSIDNIIEMFCSNVSNYMDSSMIENSLNILINNNIININAKNIILNNTTKITNENEIYQLPDPIDSTDKYDKTIALSYYRGKHFYEQFLKEMIITSDVFINTTNKYLPTKHDIITSEKLVNEVYGDVLILNLETIYKNLIKITNMNIIKSETCVYIDKQIKTFNFDSNINILNDQNIKIIYNNDESLVADSVFMNNGLQSIPNIITDQNIDMFIQYNFINQLLKTEMMKYNSDYIYKIISLYNQSGINGSMQNIFPQNMMISIVNLCNTYSTEAIEDVITKLEHKMNDENMKSSSKILNKIKNPLFFDQIIYSDKYFPHAKTSELCYNEKIFYLYNYVISQLYYQDIDFSTKYESTDKPTNYTIYISDTDLTFNLNDKYIGPTLKVNSNIIDQYDKKYFMPKYYVGPTLYNIYSLLNYFSKIINEPIDINYNTSTGSTLGSLFNHYYNSNSSYYLIAGLLEYINKYSPSLSSDKNEEILNKYGDNLIIRTICKNLDLFVYIIVNATNIYCIADHLNGLYSIIDNTTYLLKTNKYFDSTNTVIQIPYIDTFMTDTNTTQISCNEFIDYFKGVLRYQLHNSMYRNYISVFEAQWNAYKNMYDKLIDTTDIGHNTAQYSDLFGNIECINYDAELSNMTYFNETALYDCGLDITKFKSLYTYSLYRFAGDAYQTFVNNVSYLQNNFTRYQTNIPDIRFVNTELNFDKYYSNINGFYNYIINDTKPTTYVAKLFKQLLLNFKNYDADTYNNYISNILNTNVLTNSIINISFKKSLNNLNIYQIVDLHNFNMYYKKSINNLNSLENDFMNIQLSDNQMINGGNKYKIFEPIVGKKLVINDYIGVFFRSILMNLDNYDKNVTTPPTKNEVLLYMQNTLVSEKIKSSVNDFNMLDDNEKKNIIRLYNDIPQICGYISQFLIQGCYGSIDELNDKLKKCQITSTLYDQTISTTYQYYNIIMTEREYDEIFSNPKTYDFNKNSIGILIFDRTKNIVYSIDDIPYLDPTSTKYEFTLYRKTDLPFEYKYVFNSAKPKINEIYVKNEIDSIYEYLYNQISIYGDNIKIIENIGDAHFLICFSEVPMNNILEHLSDLEIVNRLDLINYCSESYCINYMGLAYYNLYYYYGIDFVKLLKKMANPIKTFNYLYYESYITPHVFLNMTTQKMTNDELNYSANLTILFYEKEELKRLIIKLYLKMFQINPFDTLKILAYIHCINSVVESDIINKYPHKVNKYILTSDDKPEIQHITLNNSLYLSKIQAEIINVMELDYAVNFIVILYQYNELNEVIENPVLHLMNYIWVNNKQLYEYIMDRIRSIDPSNVIYNEIKKYTGDINDYENINIEKIDVIDPNIDKYYKNIINSDEADKIFSIKDIEFSSKKTITIKNQFLSDSHKLMRIIKPSKQIPFELCQIKSITNKTNAIYVNFPYIFRDLIESVYIYGNKYYLYTDENKKLDIDIFIKINKYDNSKRNIPSMYPNDNIIEISFVDKYDNTKYIQINKNYISSEVVQLYINNENELYLTDNYYIGNDQEFIKTKIVATGDYFTVITMANDISEIDQIQEIQFGLNNILSIEYNNIYYPPSNISLDETTTTLYDVLSKLNVYELIDSTININYKKKMLNENLRSYGSKYYKQISTEVTNNKYNLAILIDTIISVAKSNEKLLSSSFYTLKPNNDIINYKYDISNISDITTTSYDLITYLNKLINESLTDSNMLEITNYNKKYIEYDNVSEFLNKPDIPSFSYIPYLADFIFDNINFNIDGVSVDELRDNYMYIYHNMLNSKTKRLCYNRMNYNNERLLINSQSKNNIVLFIEVPLYFTQISGLSYPLIASNNSKLELVFKIKQLDELIIKNKFIDLTYKNLIKLTAIYSVVYLDDKERELFSLSRHEYLYEKKIYNTPTEPTGVNVISETINNATNEEKYKLKYHLPFTSPVLDYYYYIQIKSMINAKQYYNYTFNYLLPDLYMTTRDKVIYLQQIIDSKQYDDKIYQLYLQCVILMIDKMKAFDNKIISYESNTKPLFEIININNLGLLYNNLTLEDQTSIETYFNQYYEDKLQEEIIPSSKLYLNSTKRYYAEEYYTNKVIPYQSYNNMIPGLQIYNFSLHPHEYQPSGYANFTTLNPEIEIDITNYIAMYKNIKNVLNSNLLARSYNIIRFISGIAGMAWNT